MVGDEPVSSTCVIGTWI